MFVKYTRQHPCFAWRKGCTKKAEVVMETNNLYLAMCEEHAKDFEGSVGYKVTPLPEEPK